MKNIFAFIIAATLAINAGAQTIPLPGAASTLIGAGTNTVLGVRTNGFVTIASENFTDVALFINFNYHAAPSAGDVNALRADLYRGIDASTFETNVWQSITFSAGSSTAAASTVTNLALAGIPYVRLRLANVSTNAIATNITLKYLPKRQTVSVR